MKKFNPKSVLFLIGCILTVTSNLKAQSLPPRPDLMSSLLVHELELKSSARLKSVQYLEQGPKSDWVQIVLSHSRTQDIHLLLKGPSGFLQNAATQKYSTVLVASGFFTGQESLRFMGDFDKTVLVGYQYPYNLESIQANPLNFLNLVRETSGQIALSLQWLSNQPWSSSNDLVAVGVSLGGIFMPSALYLAEQIGVHVPRVALVCTGAHLTPIIEAQMTEYIGRREAQVLAWGIANLSSLHDPKLYLPLLKGDYLVLHADQDEVIPASSAHMIEQLLPQSKVQTIRGRHINTERHDVIEQTRVAILRWLGRI